ncbi:MAG: hypothetical protein C0429_13305 [Sphingopyxis sp.]|nr:hypothetical protein [Sphingopyxis sp.]
MESDGGFAFSKHGLPTAAIRRPDSGAGSYRLCSAWTYREAWMTHLFTFGLHLKTAASARALR